MSIWGSGTDCGQNDEGEFDGSVLNYINGFSNHYPNTEAGMEGRRETPAAVGTAWVPPWCVPGHFDRDDLDNGEAQGQWMRLDVAYNNVSVWSGDFEVGEQDVVSVVMREDAVRKLRDSLTRWLDIPKLDGVPTPVEPSHSLRARLTAFARDCTLNGDMTPAAERMMAQILEES